MRRAMLAVSLIACLGCAADPQDELEGAEERLSQGPQPFTPCGGEVEGTWRAYEVAFTPDNPQLQMLSAACPGVRVLDQVKAEGVFVLAEGMFTRQVAMTGSYKVLLPAECVATFGAPTCDALSPLFSEALGNPTTCAPSDDSTCRCVARFDRTALYFSHAGTYSTDGTTLTLQSPQRGTDTYQYCAQGDRLVLEAGGVLDLYAQ